MHKTSTEVVGLDYVDYYYWIMSRGGLEEAL